MDPCVRRDNEQRQPQSSRINPGATETQRANPMPPRDLVLVLLIVLAWAGNFLTSALALREIPPFLFTALRFALLAIPLLYWMKRPAPGQWPRLLAMGLCVGVLHFRAELPRAEIVGRPVLAGDRAAELRADDRAACVAGAG
jgi:hypothetical protein